MRVRVLLPRRGQSLPLGFVDLAWLGLGLGLGLALGLGLGLGLG